VNECKPLGLGGAQAPLQAAQQGAREVCGRGLHSSTSQINLSRSWSLKPRQESTYQLNLRAADEDGERRGEDNAQWIIRHGPARARGTPHGGQGESLVPLYTRGSVSHSLSLISR